MGKWKELAEPPCKTGSQCTNKCQRCGEINPAEIHTCTPQAQYSDIVSDGGLDPRRKFDVTPQREWQGLTAKDLAEIPPSCYEGAIWAEAKLKEKNT